ncbi:MAG: very-short-patch-repair endonuclease [Flavobacteriales bacterium]|jgi:very-short-patch-repair endonuclease
MENKIAYALEKSRQELLDIGLRGNSLLHFKTRVVSLHVVDEKSLEIYKILVEENRKMSFLPLPKKMETNGDEQLVLLPELFEEHLDKNRHTDNKLQTKLSSDQLDRKLLRINTDAATYFQEQGIDILYIALGFLSWFEDKNSDLERKAPLVLIPVSLERSSAQERYKVKYTQVDLGTNLTLGAKLKTDFLIELPKFTEEIDLEEYFNQVRKVIKKEDRWKVIENEIHMGFFKFGKFQMYQDLDKTKWAEDNQPGDHPIIKSLFGEGFLNESKDLENEVAEESISKSLQSLEAFHFIADADSSQSEAIIRIKKGQNLVIQGPPGTGKSQTITNIISESLSDNKKILFVSEKMVALEVVKRRLDKCHLGEAVLELHSHKSNKKAVLNELGKTLDLGAPDVDDRSMQIDRYNELKNKLDQYCVDVKTKIENSDIDFVTVVGLYDAIKKGVENKSLNSLRFEGDLKWNQKDFVARRILIQDVISHIEQYGIPSLNPFFKSKIDSFSPSDKSNFVALMKETISTMNECQFEIQELLKLVPVLEPKTFIEIEKYVFAVNYLNSIPDLKTVDYGSSLWMDKQDIIENLLKSGQRIDELRDGLGKEFIASAFEYDYSDVRREYKTKGNKWWRFLSIDFRKAKTSLKGLIKKELPSSDRCMIMIDEFLEYQSLNKSFDSDKKIGKKLFGDKWIENSKNWDELSNINNWLTTYYSYENEDLITDSFIDILDKLSPNMNYSKNTQKLRNLLEQIDEKINKINKKLKIESSKEKSYKISKINNVIDDVNMMVSGVDKIFDISRYNILRTKLNDKGLNQIGDLSFDWNHDQNLLIKLFDYSWYKTLLDHAYKTRKSILYFDRVGHENDILEFRILDNKLAHFSQEQLTMKHFKNLPSFSAAGEMALIRREINKKRRHLPIRQLLLKAGNAVQQIKPVFMMSPMSVATFLAQGVINFDLVIFDEASQVKVVDALIPILRGKQIVVVGDSKQMPPTDFFSRNFENDEEEEETVTGDIESILSMFLAQGAPESMLKWHYRSKHESLINVSNQEFYEGKLKVFPSSGTDSNAKGLKFNHITNSHYERGLSRTNPIEARKVAEQVFNHAKNYSDLTLGVVAFSTAQRDCILLEVERLRRLDSSYEEFFSSSNDEEFFVKNLENVQGDERDVIYISIGYGKTQHGNLPKNFGPVNREGGERRLNVLITRARLAMEVFCNFTADDLETNSTTPFGVRALKNFLRYAKEGVLSSRHETGKETDSPFEDQIISAIRQLGFDVEPQVGSAGFFIDIAVRDPGSPGKYVLAVECDGATYHSSASARDRDRLRQSVLEGMGWKFHRIWSTDWFRAPKKEIEKLNLAIREALDISRVESVVTSRSVNVKTSIENKITRQKKEVKEEVKNYYSLSIGKFNVESNYDILEVNKIKLAGIIAQIVKIEGAIHLRDVSKRITESMGISKVGSRIYSHMNVAADYGNMMNYFYFENEYVYLNNSKEIQVRDRSQLPNVLKNIERIPKEEVQKALISVIKEAFSIEKEEAISESLNLMGFKKATEKASIVIKVEIEKLQKLQKLKIENNKLTIDEIK